MKKYQVWIIFAICIAAVCFWGRGGLERIWRDNINMSLSDFIPRDIAKDRADYFQKNPDVLRLACIGDWQGYSQNGIPAKESIELAAEEINAAGGIKGIPVEILWLDDKGKVSQVQKHVETCIQDTTLWGIVGPLTSSKVALVKDRISSSGMVHIAPLCQSDQLKQSVHNSMLFKPIHSVSDEAKAISDWVDKHMNQKEFVLINEDENFCTRMSGHVERLFHAQGTTLHNRLVFSTDSKNGALRDALMVHKRYYPNDLYIFIGGMGSLQHACQWAPEYLFKGMNKTLIVNQEAASLSDLEKINSAQLLVTSSLKKDDNLINLLNKLDHTVKFRKNLLSIYMYRSIYLLKDALEHADDMKPATVAKYMSSHPLNTPLGEFRFDADGFEDNPYVEIISFDELKRFWEKFNSASQKAIP